jgi:adenylate cyclase
VRLRIREVFDALTDPRVGEHDASRVAFTKGLLVRLTVLAGVAGPIWGALYFGFGARGAALLPWGYTVLVVIGTALLRNGPVEHYRNFQLGLILIVPFGLDVALGGFRESSAVILWSLLAPIGAFLLQGARGAQPWLWAYLVLVLGSSLTPSELALDGDIPDALRRAFFVLNAGTVSGVVLVLLSFFARENRRVVDLLEREKDKSDRLLLNVLPADIAERLREDDHRGTVADHFDEVSILFADIAGFTRMSERLAPAEMVDLLNLIFSRFDELVTHYGVEKIRTIGDNYMVVAGAPRPRPDHASVLARMALDMCASVDDLPPLDNGDRLLFRIGINSGPVVAGVVGTTKFHYDVWGDAVNVASRMESHGIPGRIQVAPATHSLIADQFVCVPRGPIEVKGKGTIDTWLLDGAMTRSGT